MDTARNPSPPPPLAVPQPPIPPYSSINPLNPDPSKINHELIADMGIQAPIPPGPTPPPPKSLFNTPAKPTRMVFSPTLLQNARIAAGLSKRRAGLRYGMTERTAGNWAIYENGIVTDPRPSTIATLAAVVGVPPEALMQLPEDVPTRTPDPIADARRAGEGVGYRKASADFEALRHPIRMEGYHLGQIAGYASGVRKACRNAYEAGWFDGYEACKRGDNPQIPDLSIPTRAPWFGRSLAPATPTPATPTPAPEPNTPAPELPTPDPLPELPIPDYTEPNHVPAP